MSRARQRLHLSVPVHRWGPKAHTDGILAFKTQVQPSNCIEGASKSMFKVQMLDQAQLQALNAVNSTGHHSRSCSREAMPLRCVGMKGFWDCQWSLSGVSVLIRTGVTAKSISGNNYMSQDVSSEPEQKQPAFSTMLKRAQLCCIAHAMRHGSVATALCRHSGVMPYQWCSTRKSTTLFHTVQQHAPPSI